MSSNIKYVLQVALSVLTFGLVWIVDNQAAVITALAIVIVWALNTFFLRWGVKLGRQYVTAILYAVSLVLVVIVNPVVIPDWPTIPPDPALAVSAFAAWAQLLVVALLPYTAGAMTIYNLLLKAVLERLPWSLPEPPAMTIG